MMRRSACLSLVLTALSLSACALDGAEVPEEVSQSSAALDQTLMVVELPGT